jgi:hypothetical protein
MQFLHLNGAGLSVPAKTNFIELFLGAGELENRN